MEIKNPKISFELTNSFGDISSIEMSLEDDTIYAIARQFRAFLLSTGFAPQNIDEIMVDKIFESETDYL
jgi:hypothetical protein